MELGTGAAVGIVGGGPAGSFTGYFLLELADRLGRRLSVDIYEPKSFTRFGPAGCNHCAGIVSESLVQELATEGIVLPETVVQRGLDTYVLHLAGTALAVQAPVPEKRIAALHRGRGPLGCRGQDWRWESFDDFLLRQAVARGANHLAERVVATGRDADRPTLTTAGGTTRRYDLVIGASGINSPGDTDLYAPLGLLRQAPRRVGAAIAELSLGADEVEARFASAMHVFLPSIPGLRFAALIPKSEYVTLCLLGDGLTSASMQTFLALPEVRACLPELLGESSLTCRCLPSLNVHPGSPVYGDRVALVGDCAVTRLYKDGIGSAYRLAKACALTALLHGVENAAWRGFYWPHCRRLHHDNLIGLALFRLVQQLQAHPSLQRAVIGVLTAEQSSGHARLGPVLWDLFTGSADYRDILRRGLALPLLRQFAGAWGRGRRTPFTPTSVAP